MKLSLRVCLFINFGKHLQCRYIVQSEVKLLIFQQGKVFKLQDLLVFSYKTICILLALVMSGERKKMNGDYALELFKQSAIDATLYKIYIKIYVFVMYMI